MGAITVNDGGGGVVDDSSDDRNERLARGRMCLRKLKNTRRRSEEMRLGI